MKTIAAVAIALGLMAFTANAQAQGVTGSQAEMQAESDSLYEYGQNLRLQAKQTKLRDQLREQRNDPYGLCETELGCH